MNLTPKISFWSFFSKAFEEMNNLRFLPKVPIPDFVCDIFDAILD